MKNSVLLFAITFALFSCQNEEIAAPTEEIIEEVQTTVSEAQSEENNDEDAQKNFDFLEDYASISNRDELELQFGEVNLTDDTVWLAEGTVMKVVTKVINPHNWHHITYFWDESGALESVEADYYMWSNVGEIKGSQRVEAKNGLYTGMLLEDFIAWNGADIKFAGFGWDYAGNIFPNQEGQLSNSNVDVTLINKQEKYDGYDFMIGDVELNSGEERMKNAPVVIETLSLSLINEEE